jgi:hypothetical protein
MDERIPKSIKIVLETGSEADERQDEGDGKFFGGLCDVIECNEFNNRR